MSRQNVKARTFRHPLCNTESSAESLTPDGFYFRDPHQSPIYLQCSSKEILLSVEWTGRAATSSQDWAWSIVPTGPQTQCQLRSMPDAHKHINQEGIRSKIQHWSTVKKNKKNNHALITKAPQYRKQHDAAASCLYREEFWVQCHSEKKKKRPNVCCKCVGLFSAGFISLNAEEAVNLRLRSSSDAKAYEAPQEQQPAIHRSKGTQQAEVQQPAHRNHQTLFPKWVKHQIMHWKH